MEKITLTVEIVKPDPSFRPDLYARSVAFRALRFAEAVKVSGDRVNIQMSAKPEQSPPK